MKGKRLDMKLFGNSSGSKHASNGGRHVSSAKPVKKTQTDKTENPGYSREEAQQYARKMSEQNARYAEGASPRAAKSSKKVSRKKRTIRALIIVLLVIAAIVAAGAIWWKASVKPPEQSGGKKPTIVLDDPSDSTVDPETPGQMVTKPDAEDEPTEAGGKYTFLVLGMDDGNGNTDTIMAATFDTTEYTVDVVSIPRDTLVNVPWTVRKANTLYHNYGKEGIKTAMADLLGYEPGFFVIVDIEAFVVLINDIGGVDYNVPINMNYDDPYQDLHIHISKGMQHLTGEQAIGVMRYRKGYADADIGRIDTQQDFLKTVANQILANKSSLSISALADVFLNYVETDLTYGNIIWLAKEFFKVPSDNINFHTVPANYNGYANGTSYVLIYVDEWLEMINECLNPFEEPITVEDLDILTKNSKGQLYATSGVKKGKASWGVTSSTTSNNNTTTKPDNNDKPADNPADEPVEEPTDTPTTDPTDTPADTPTDTPTETPDTPATPPTTDPGTGGETGNGGETGGETETPPVEETPVEPDEEYPDIII